MNFLCGGPLDNKTRNQNSETELQIFLRSQDVNLPKQQEAIVRLNFTLDSVW